MTLYWSAHIYSLRKPLQRAQMLLQSSGKGCLFKDRTTGFSISHEAPRLLSTFAYLCVHVQHWWQDFIMVWLTQFSLSRQFMSKWLISGEAAAAAPLHFFLGRFKAGAGVYVTSAPSLQNIKTQAPDQATECRRRAQFQACVWEGFHSRSLLAWTRVDKRWQQHSVCNWDRR